MIELAIGKAEVTIMSFVEELKRRNVFKVAIAYVIVAWLIAQVTELALDSFASPEWVMKTVLFLMIIGFPLALIFAWAFELTPDGIKLEKDVAPSESVTHMTGRKLDFIIIAVLALALVYFAYDELVIELGQEDASVAASTQTGEVTETNAADMSVAVLPFINISGDPDNEYFADGLAEEILNLLAKIPGLKVIGRTSSFAFKGKNEDLRLIGEALGVKTVLEGSVRKSGDLVRITAQLNDVSDGSHIWSETYDRTMTDIFAVQDDVAAAIIEALQIHVGAKPMRGRPTENMEAYALFLRARVSLNNLDVRGAEELVLKAIELDPNFAEAYELLAHSYWNLAGTGVEVAKGRELTRDAAAKALAIDPDLVFALALYQSANVENYSYLRSVEAFERAVREQPSNPGPLDTLIFDLEEAGYFREALVVAERFVSLDPLSPVANIRLFETLYAVGRTSEAVAALELGDQLGSKISKWMIGIVNLVERRDDIAIAHIEAHMRQNGLPNIWVRDLVAGARDPVSGQKHLDRRIPQIVASMPEEYAYAMRRALKGWYLIFGYLDRYFEIIDLELTNSSWTDADVFVTDGTIFRRLGFTAHPKYVQVAEALNIVELWEHRGPPDFCEQVDGQWICE